LQNINYYIVLFFLTEAYRQDLDCRKISNRLILAGIGCGAFLRIFTEGLGQIERLAADLLLPVGLLFILYLFRVLGAGDLKLFSMISTFIGARACFYVICYAFCAAAAAGLLCILKRKKWGLTKAGFAEGILLAYIFWLTLQMLAL
jgi:prepilin peptidase CpaA